MLKVDRLFCHIRQLLCPIPLHLQNPAASKFCTANFYDFALSSPRFPLQRNANTQTVWVADVGQNAREEVDIVERGARQETIATTAY